MITKTDKFWVFFIIAAVMAKLSFATDNIVIIDTSNPSQKKASTITLTNNSVIHKTDAVTKESVQGTTTSAGAGDSGKIPKLNSGGKIDKTMMIGVPFTNMVVYSSSHAAAEWTNSTACTFIMVECWGGGGSGAAGLQANPAGGGGGGGGGSYCRSYLNVGATNHFFVIGGASAASTFLTMSAGGGSGGTVSSAGFGGIGGAGGTATGGQLNINGTAGCNGFPAGTSTTGHGGNGGAGAAGGGGGQGSAAATGGNGTSGTTGGGGGGAGGVTGGGAGAGGTGGSGQVVIHFN